MVGRRDRHGVNVLVRERLADVAVRLRPLALGAFDKFCSSFQHFRIHIAQSHILGFILHLEDVFDVRGSLAVEADRADPDATVGITRLRSRAVLSGNDRSGSRRQKRSTG